MAEVSQAKAARLAGVSRTTIHTKIKAGVLSLSPDKKIDTSELIRVFGQISDHDPLQDAQKPVQQADQLTVENEYLKQRIRDLESAAADIRQDRDRLRSEIDRLQSQVESLIDQHKPRTLLQLIGWNRQG
jgi:predicted  nucleic acid-binding Zn-ribbon protein